MTENICRVICIKPVYVDDRFINVYEVGQIYDAKYLYQRVLISDNEVIEYEWIVYCGVLPGMSRYNHYQFTDKEFNMFFKDIVKERNKKLESLINI